MLKTDNLQEQLPNMRKVIIPTRSGLILFCLVFFGLNGIPGLAAKDSIMIGFSQATMNHPWRVAMVAGNEKYAAEHFPDVDLIVTDGQNSATKQVSDVESLMTRGIKVLIISPLQAQALTPIIKQVMEAKIPVVTLDREVNTNVTCRIGAENEPIAESAGKLIAEKLGGKGNIIEIQGTAGASATIDRHNGFRDSLKEAPDTKVVADQYCDYLREPAVKFIEDMLQRFGPGQIQAIYAHNDEMALGAAKAVAGPVEQKRSSSSESTARIVRLKPSKTANWQQRSSIRSVLQKASSTLTKSQRANKFPSASSCSPLAWTLQMWISILARDSRSTTRRSLAFSPVHVPCQLLGRIRRAPCT